MPDGPRLRGDSGSNVGPWPIGQIPESVVRAIGRQFVLRLATGRNDISGDEFADIFADAVGGHHFSSPIGLADVEKDTTTWSVKTVKANRPHSASNVRLISGRNSPDYSQGIKNPHRDIQKTGDAVLSVWNSRLNAARQEHEDVRIMVLVRNMDTREFTLFEEEISRYAPGDFTWSYTKSRNLMGVRIADGERLFTWQFHGSQFTIHRKVPGSAVRFSIDREVPIIEPSHIESTIGFTEDWIQID